MGILFLLCGATQGMDSHYLMQSMLYAPPQVAGCIQPCVNALRWPCKKEPENSLVLDGLGMVSTWHDLDNATVYSARETIKYYSDSYVITYTKDCGEHELNIGFEPTCLALNSDKTILLAERIEWTVDYRNRLDLVAVSLATKKVFKLDKYGEAFLACERKLGFYGNRAVARYGLTHQEWDLAGLGEAEDSAQKEE